MSDTRRRFARSRRNAAQVPSLPASAGIADVLAYNDEEQPWCTQLPPIRDVNSDDLVSLADRVEIVLITATEPEVEAVLRLLKPSPRRRAVLKGFVGPETYYLGRFASCFAAVTKCRMGSVEAGAAAQHALHVWRPKAVVMVGIAMGRDPAKQKIADVLVASQIISYEPQRVGVSQIIARGPIPPADPTLLNRFENLPHWSFARPDGLRCERHVGPLLSGEKLVDDPEFKAELFERYPQAIGGEMEGVGLAAAAVRNLVPWILVKGICDWADGKKHKKHQPLAAAAAVSLVYHALSQAEVLNGLPKLNRQKQTLTVPIATSDRFAIVEIGKDEFSTALPVTIVPPAAEASPKKMKERIGITPKRIGIRSASSPRRTTELLELLAGRCWVTYGPSEGYDPTQGRHPNVQVIQSDLQRIRKAGFTGVITFSSHETMAEVPRLARDADLGIIMGVWNPADREEFTYAIDQLEYVDAYCVGHNGLNRRYSLDDLEACIGILRRRTKKPVTTSAKASFYKGNERLCQMGDWVFPDFHLSLRHHSCHEPCVDVKRDVAVFLKSVKTMVDLVRLNRVNGRERLLMIKTLLYPWAGVTGASLDNQRRFFEAVLAARDDPHQGPSTPIAISFHSAFDYPWKIGALEYDAWDPFSGLIDDKGGLRPAGAVIVRKWNREC